MNTESTTKTDLGLGLEQSSPSNKGKRMKTLKTTLAFVAMTMITAASHADSVAPQASDQAVIRQGSSIVVGHFTGKSEAVVRKYQGLFDDHGNPIEFVEVNTMQGFQVQEVLSGLTLPEEITIAVVGGVAAGHVTQMVTPMPMPGARVLLSLQPDRRGNHVIISGRVFSVDSDDQLEDLRDQTKDLRAVQAPSKQALREQAALEDLEPLKRERGRDPRLALVSGFFTGEVERIIQRHEGLSDEGDLPFTHEEVVTLAQFIVMEQVNGAPIRRKLTVAIVGGESDGVVTPAVTKLPLPGERVLVSLQPTGTGLFSVFRDLIVPEADLEHAASVRTRGRILPLAKDRQEAAADTDTKVDSPAKGPREIVLTKE